MRRQLANRSGRLRWALPAACIAAALLVPRLTSDGFVLQILELLFVYALLALSLNVVFGYLGYLPFSHIAFFGVGAYGMALVYLHSGKNLWLGILAGLLLAALASALLGLLTLHLRGFYFTIITLAFAEMIRLAAQDFDSLTGGSNGISLFGKLLLPVPGGGVDLSDSNLVYGITVVVAGALTLALALLMLSGWGRVSRGLRDSEPLARALGIHAFAIKLFAFVVASSVAAVAGELYALYFQFISPGSLEVEGSLLLLLMILLGGKDHFWAPLIGVVVFVVFPPVVQMPEDAKWLSFGAVMLLVVVALPRGLGGEAVSRIRARRRVGPEAPGLAAELRARAAAGRRAGSGGGAPAALAVHGVTRRFGGVMALADVSLALDGGGEVLGLVGPNGSGKTTLFNVVSGFLRPDAGRIVAGGHDITGRRPEHIANLGLVRTFQQESAFSSLTVAEAFFVAGAGGSRGGVLSVLREGFSARSRNLGGSAPISELSHGEQRLLEIALAVAARPALLLLDEPMAGLGGEEAGWVTEIIREISATGVSVLLIEHHMETVMDVCDRLVVLNEGRKIAEGPPEEVVRDAEVRRAYLGSFGAELTDSLSRGPR